MRSIEIAGNCHLFCYQRQLEGASLSLNLHVDFSKEFKIEDKMSNTQRQGNSHGHKGTDACCSSFSDSGVRQSLSELEFERGIWYAAQYNDEEKVERLLRKGIPADVKDVAGYTALHYAARNGHDQICEILLQHGAYVDAKTGNGGATALHRAAAQGHVKVVQILLENGADASLKDADGYTPLHRALIGSHVSVCRILIPHSDLTIVDNKNRSVKQLANEYCNELLSHVTYDTRGINEC